MSTALIYDPEFLQHDTGDFHPENAQRLKVILAALKDDKDLWDKLIHLKPHPANRDDILRCHTSELIEYVSSLCHQGVSYIDADTAICPASFDVALLAAGAGITGVDQLFTKQITNAFALIRPPGHHATSKQAMGFCLFNNIAIAARYAQFHYGIKNILIIDWDVHHGNGTQEIFYTDPSIFYFSTHEYPFYPGTGGKDERGVNAGLGYTLNIPLAYGTSAKDHRAEFSKGLAAITKIFHPELILISAGFDAHIGDPLANLNLFDEDYKAMTEEVMAIADKYANGRIISFLEGGYNLVTLGGAAKTHIETLANN